MTSCSKVEYNSISSTGIDSTTISSLITLYKDISRGDMAPIPLPDAIIRDVWDMSAMIAKSLKDWHKDELFAEDMMPQEAEAVKQILTLRGYTVRSVKRYIGKVAVGTRLTLICYIGRRWKRRSVAILGACLECHLQWHSLPRGYLGIQAIIRVPRNNRNGY